MTSEPMLGAMLKHMLKHCLSNAHRFQIEQCTHVRTYLQDWLRVLVSYLGNAREKRAQ